MAARPAIFLGLPQTSAKPKREPANSQFSRRLWPFVPKARKRYWTTGALPGMIRQVEQFPARRPDKSRNIGIWIKRVILLGTTLVTLLPNAFAQTVTFCDVPTALPRNTPLLNYSPALCFEYRGLQAQAYTLKVFLLETASFNCASGQWCGDASIPSGTLAIDNRSGTAPAGRLTVVRNMDVYDYAGFLWVVDLYDQAGAKVNSATQSAISTPNRSPILNPVGDKVGRPGQRLEFVVSASDPEGDALTLSAQNLPPGATFDITSRTFRWASPVSGTYSTVLFKATQVGSVPLSDAELISIRIGEPTQALALDASSHRTGEGGPAVITVIRTGEIVGTVTVNYATAALSATAGSDFRVASGVLTFGPGETRKAVVVPIVNDSIAEPNETLTVSLSNSMGASLGSPSTTTVTIVDDDNAAVSGRWSSVAPWPVVPIHVHLLPTGKVMAWDRHDHTLGWDGDPRLWDPATQIFSTVPSPGYDLFCSGHSFLANGRLFVTGGHDPKPPPLDKGVGLNKASAYDPFTNSWTRLPDMNAGRWYPTNLALANGDVLVLAGTSTDVNTVNPLPQVWQAASGTWRDLTAAQQGRFPTWADFYPFLYLDPQGRVFHAGPQQTSRYLDPSGTGVWAVGPNSGLLYRDYGSSVMFDDGKVLIVGGNPREPDPNAPPTIMPSNTAEVINLKEPTPAWRPVLPMAVGRRHHNTTMLPDGKVLVIGGSGVPGFDNPLGAIFFAEMWDPADATWSILAGHSRYRGYHSTALLLPDGRVLVGGGGHPDPPGGTEERNIEIYSPPYLFKGVRPSITFAPGQVAYGQRFVIQTPEASGIATITLLRLPSVTHGFDQNQRLNRLSFSPVPGGLCVTAPSTSNLSPPGHYMLFILNREGVPSTARIIQVLPSVSQPAPAVGGVANGASFLAELAPGSIASLFGTDLAAQTLSASALPLPTTLGDVQVLVNGAPVPLFYVSQRQINFLLPPGLSGSSAQIAVKTNVAISQCVEVRLVSEAPGIFTVPAGGQGQGAVLNEDNSLNSEQNRARTGTVIQIFATGLGSTIPEVPAGHPAPTAPLSVTTTTPVVMVNGVASEVEYSGLAPGYVGLYQVNARIPLTSDTGSALPLQIRVGVRSSNQVRIAVR